MYHLSACLGPLSLCTPPMAYPSRPTCPSWRAGHRVVCMLLPPPLLLLLLLLLSLSLFLSLSLSLLLLLRLLLLLLAAVFIVAVVQFSASGSIAASRRLGGGSRAPAFHPRQTAWLIRFTAYLGPLCFTASCFLPWRVELSTGGGRGCVSQEQRKGEVSGNQSAHTVANKRRPPVSNPLPESPMRSVFRMRADQQTNSTLFRQSHHTSPVSHSRGMRLVNPRSADDSILLARLWRSPDPGSSEGGS